MGSSDTAVFTVRSKTRGKRRLDIFDSMKADHDRLSFLTAALRLTQDGAPMQSMRPLLIDRLSDTLEAYSTAAEQCFYAALMAQTGDEQHARRGVGAHDQAATLLTELSEMEATDETWQALVDRLASLLKDHFRQTEEEIIPLAKTLLGPLRSARLGARYDEAKRRWTETFGRLPASSETPESELQRVTPQTVERALSAEFSANFAENLAGQNSEARARSRVLA